MADAEPNGTIAENAECAIDWRSPACPLLVNGRRSFAELANATRQDEHTVGFYMGAFGNLIAEAYHRRIDTRRHHKL